MLNAAAFACSASAWQRAGASAAATFLTDTRAIGLPAQFAKSGCLTQRVPWGAGLGDGGGVLGLGDGVGLTPGGIGDGLGTPALGGEGLGPGAGLGDGTGLTPGADGAAQGLGGVRALGMVGCIALSGSHCKSRHRASAMQVYVCRATSWSRAKSGTHSPAHLGTRRPCRSPGHWHCCMARRWRRGCACTRPWRCCSWALASRTVPLRTSSRTAPLWGTREVEQGTRANRGGVAPAEERRFHKLTG
jgi:hypothetical protein